MNVYGMVGIPAALLSVGAVLLWWMDNPFGYHWWNMDDGTEGADEFPKKRKDEG